MSKPSGDAHESNPYQSPHPVANPLPQRVEGFDTQPHRGPLILSLGILGLCMAPFACVVCVPPLLVSMSMSITAWVLGHLDLNTIRRGAMDPSGESATQIGAWFGIAGRDSTAARPNTCWIHRAPGTGRPG